MTEIQTASFVLAGIKAHPISIVVGQTDQPFEIMGLPRTAQRETALRVRCAFEETFGQRVPHRMVFVHAGGLRLRAPCGQLDLPIALALAAQAGIVDPSAIEGVLIAGEFDLHGQCRPVRGALAAAHIGAPLLISAGDSAIEAAAAERADVYPIPNLDCAVTYLRDGLPDPQRPVVADFGSAKPPDMSDVRGQAEVITAIETALVDRKGILLIGPPGIGKTMIARRVPTILPPLSRKQRIETSLIYSACGLLSNGQLIRRPPFRAPHHTVSSAAMVGARGRPGEFALAKHGVLFLDELSEFRPDVLRELRGLDPSLTLIASDLPCPCGWFQSEHRACVCSGNAIGRRLDRLARYIPIDQLFPVRLRIEHTAMSDLRDGEPAESSAVIRDRIVAARKELS